MKKVIVVGGVAGGASAAARLRRLDEHASIIMFEKGPYISFANCGLPYYIGGTITDKNALTLQTPESFNARFNVDVRINTLVKSIDPDKKTVLVEDLINQREYEESYDQLILSPGAEPIKPPLPGIDLEEVFTLRTIPDTYKIHDYIAKSGAKRAVVVGGGYIGTEMAENLHEAGLDVTIVEAFDHVIASIDYDMACDVHRHIREKGCKLILNDAVKAIEKKNDHLIVTLGGQVIDTDMVIMSVGVKPDSKLAKSAGIETNPRGAIVVNESMQTNVEDIYAIGDAVEVEDFISKGKTYIPLAGPANKQGRIVADHICGIPSSYHGTQGTGILKCFDLTVASTGITEKRAKDLEIPYEKVYTYSGSHASYYPNAVSMSIKLIYEKATGKILGSQIVGYDGVDKRIDVLATAIRANMTIFDLTNLELAYAPPFSSAKDPVNMAGYVAENVFTQKTKIFHWNQVDEVKKDSNAIILDIRTKMEYENGHIESSINIPLDELRQHLYKLDKNKTIYVVCQIGLRGHVASRILSQYGYDCYNLSGGYRLYHSIFSQVALVETLQNDTQVPMGSKTPNSGAVLEVNACGLQCPGPIMKLAESIQKVNDGDVVIMKTTDPAFNSDVQAWCRRTGNNLISTKSEKGISTIEIEKATNQIQKVDGTGKNIIVFSGDLDKAIASFIIANAAASMGRKVSMFFTFWGLNILRRPEKVKVKKNMISKAFAMMMPRGSKKLKLSNMNMGGIGGKLIRGIMKEKNINSLEELIASAQANGVELVACTMSMDVMGIQMEELIDGVIAGGAAAMIAHAEESDMSLFI